MCCVLVTVFTVHSTGIPEHCWALINLSEVRFEALRCRPTLENSNGFTQSCSGKTRFEVAHDLPWKSF